VTAFIGRRERTLMLLRNYRDFCDAERSGDDVRAGKPQSGVLHRGWMWRQGSFAELERALELLREHSAASRNGRRHWFGHLWTVYVEPAYIVRVTGPKASDVQKVRKTWDPAIQSNADLALEWIVKRMPASIFVPPELAESEGVTPTEAKRLARAA
jgi:hypothetical protein